MLLNDAFKHFGGAAVIPDAIRPDDGDRPCRADAQAIRLCAGNAALAGKPQF